MTAIPDRPHPETGIGWQEAYSNTAASRDGKPCG